MFRIVQRSCLFLATAVFAAGSIGCERTASPDEVRQTLDSEGGTRAILILGEHPDLDATVDLEESRVAEFTATLGTRLASLGYTQVLMEREGSRLSVSIAGHDTSMAKKLRAFLRPAVLELREVHPDSAYRGKPVFEGEDILPGFKAYQHNGENRDGESFTEYLLLSKRVGIHGRDIEDAWPQTQGTDHQVGVKLTEAGGEKMIQLTKEMQPGVSRIAVLLDDEIITAPVVQTTPLGRNFVLQGQDDFSEASDLARQLLTPLDLPFTLQSLEAIPASGS